MIISQGFHLIRSLNYNCRNKANGNSTNCINSNAKVLTSEFNNFKNMFHFKSVNFLSHFPGKLAQYLQAGTFSVILI